MARCIFENLTLEQAEQLARWFEGQGEQDAAIWFEENEIVAPLVDVQKKNWLTIKGDTVTVQCK